MTQLKLTLQWSLMLLLIAAALTGVVFFVVASGELLLSHLPSVKRVATIVLFWAFFGALIRMWWKIGSYYGRKS